MNQEANNDIDILLRKLSRQDGNTLNAWQDGQGAELHLDADELNSYAENALPPALRARYTVHLTECTSCRNIVTQLSLASAAVVPHKSEEAKPSALKTFLASLFSPLVFRYAVPAMAIVVVVAIAWVAVQRRSGTNQVAQNIQSEAAAPSQAQEKPTVHDSAPREQLKGQIGEPGEPGGAAGEKSTESRDAAAVNKEEAPAEERKLAAVTDDLRDREDSSKRNQPQPAAPAASGAGGATTRSVSPKPDAGADRSVEVAQKKTSDADKNKAVSEPQPYRVASPTQSEAVKEIPKSAPTDTVQTGRALRRERAKDEAEATDVRTVGGHRFRKQGQVWIDSLYSSQPTTNVSRGSEQYRALGADEPGIRSIADQLNAEFIVVWKGRAYRIR